MIDNDYILGKIIDPNSRAQSDNLGINLTIEKIEELIGIAIFKNSSGIFNSDFIKKKEVSTYGDYIDKFLKENNAESLDEIKNQMKEFAKLANDPLAKILFGLDKKDKFKKDIDLSSIDLMFSTLEAVKDDNLDSYYLEKNKEYLVTFEQGLNNLNKGEYPEIKILNSYFPYISLYQGPCIDLFNNKSSDKISTIIKIGQVPVLIQKGIPLVNLTIHGYNNKRG